MLALLAPAHDGHGVTVHAFDTHSSVKALRAAGLPEAHAEAITAVVRESRNVDFGLLATKADFVSLATKADLAELKSDILKWTVGMIGGAVVFNAMTVIGAMLALVRTAGH
jgi:hypothetical protein